MQCVGGSFSDRTLKELCNIDDDYVCLGINVGLAFMKLQITTL